MGEKETVRVGGAPIEEPPNYHSLPECFPLDNVAELKHDCFYSGLPKQLKVMVAYLKASANEKLYSDYL